MTFLGTFFQYVFELKWQSCAIQCEPDLDATRFLKQNIKFSPGPKRNTS